MIKPFLQLVAEDIHELFGTDYSDLTIVFPNKRAGLFMNRELMRLADGQPVLTPEYVTIDDLFDRLSPLTVADPIWLVARLYESYRHVTGTDEGLDRFYAWGELLLSDFEDIDNNMVDAKALFSNIEDLDELTRYDYMSEEQKAAIVQFFNMLNRGKEDGTELHERFRSVWSQLYDVYAEFRGRLKAEGKAYGGMRKREVVEGGSATNSSTTGCVCFVGFGVLNETERRLFKMIQGERQTYFYWDYDNAYLQTEAGMFVKENMRMFPNRFAGRDCYESMRAERKRLTYVASATEDAGCRFVDHCLRELQTEDEKERTAIVLCNEKVLGSVLHALAAVEGLGEMNVTMGYPLMNTLIYSLMAAMVELQMHGLTKSGNWRYSALAAFLRHPYVRLLTEGRAAEALSEMNRGGVRFPTDEYLEGLGLESEAAGRLIERTETVGELTDWMLRIVTGLKGVTDTLAVESVYQTYTMLNRLRRLTQEIEGISTEMFGRLLLSVMRTRSIPFHGEPAVGLQVMGLLETRNLDFENIIMLSVNEGQIPKIHTNNSFIPYTLRAAYGMTTIERQNALYAYYFYRLIQRARNVTFVYNTSTEGINKGEMSRFLLQLELEKDSLLAGGTAIRHTSLAAGNEMQPMKELEIRSGAEVRERIARRFDTDYDEEYSQAHHGKKMTLSPSAINEFINCRRRFFLHYVAELQTQEDMDDIDIDDATFGTLFHESMERLYKPLVGKQVESHQLLQMAKDTQLLEDTVDRAFDRHVFKHNKGNRIYNGHQLLNRHVLIQYVRRQLEYDAATCPFRLTGLEHEVYTLMQVGGRQVRVGGVIDRSQETQDGRLCIIDYKTSTRAQQTKDVESLFDGNKAGRAYHILQALYYCDVVTQEGEKRPVFPQLMYVKQSVAARANAVAIDKAEITDYATEWKEEFHSRLEETVEQIFAEDTEFSATQQPKNCEYCDFKALCGR